MAWTAPTIRNPNDLITSTIWNADLVDNLIYLASRPVAEKVHVGATYNYSGSTWQDVNATTLGLSATTSASGRFLIMGSIYASATAGGYVTFTVGGVNVGDATLGLAVVSNTAAQTMFFHYAYGLALTSHTIRMQYKTSGAGTISIMAPSRMWVIEV